MDSWEIEKELRRELRQWERVLMPERAKLSLTGLVAFLALVGAVYTVVRETVIVPYQVEELRAAQKDARTDHDLLVAIAADMKTLTRAVETQNRALIAHMNATQRDKDP